jgi:peptidoglycan/xylan/chitin deacetylase (PgdA/CDA1 family)
MKLQVCISVDVEFDISGTFHDPDRRRPAGLESVRCFIEGEDEGLGYILRTLQAHGLTATFFVEALNTCYFGDGPMGEVANEIHARGQDVELHLHPAWTYFLSPDWVHRLRTEPPNDSLAGRASAEIKSVIERGAAAFERWRLPAPLAVRAGNLTASRSVYPVMKELGITLSSHLGMGLYRPADPALHLNAGRHWIDGVLEVPVTSYADVQIGRFSHWKVLTIIGTSVGEMKAVIEAAEQAALSPVVILTHVSEYVQRARSQDSRCARNRLARKRLEDLCRFLVENAGRFEVTTFRAQSGRWLNSPGTANAVLTVSPWLAARRLLENRLSGG